MYHVATGVSTIVCLSPVLDHCNEALVADVFSAFAYKVGMRLQAVVTILILTEIFETNRTSIILWFRLHWVGEKFRECFAIETVDHLGRVKNNETGELKKTGTEKKLGNKSSTNRSTFVARSVYLIPFVPR